MGYLDTARSMEEAADYAVDVGLDSIAARFRRLAELFRECARLSSE